MAGIGVGVVVKQIVAEGASWQNCRILNSDAVGLAFEVERTINETGTVETVVSQVFLPWSSVKHLILMEQIL
jgi:hypothetical protein